MRKTESGFGDVLRKLRHAFECGTCSTRGSCRWAAPAAPKVSVVDKVKAVHQKNKLILPIVAGVLVLAIVIAIVAGVVGKQVKLSDYLNVEVTGYDGFGQLRYEFDNDSFSLRACGEKDAKGYGWFEEQDFNENQLLAFANEYKGKMKTVDKLMSSIKINIEFPEGRTYSNLVNGDVISFKIDCDEAVAKSLGITIKGMEFEYTVKDLGEAATFNLLDKFDIQATGYDGYGRGELVCTQTATTSVGDLTFTMEAGSSYIRYSTSDGYERSIYIWADGETWPSRLSNGDVVTIHSDMSETDLANYGVYLSGMTKEVTISNLDKCETVDILQYYDVVFTGVDGSGRAQVVPTQESLTVGDFTLNLTDGRWSYKGEYLTRIYVDLNSSYSLENGEELTLGFSPYESDFLSRGLKFESTEKKVTVSGLASYVTSLDQLTKTDEWVAAGKQLVSDYIHDSWEYAVHGSYFGNYTHQVVGDDLKLYKMVLTTPKSSSSSTKNTIWLIYSVTLSDDSMEPTVHYFAVKQNNLAAYPDGSVLETTTTKSKNKAYTSYDELYEALIDNFNLDITSK